MTDFNTTAKLLSSRTLHSAFVSCSKKLSNTGGAKRSRSKGETVPNLQLGFMRLASPVSRAQIPLLTKDTDLRFLVVYLFVVYLQPMSWT